MLRVNAYPSRADDVRERYFNSLLEAKHRDRFLQLPRLLLEQLRRCRRLLDQCGILLSRRIHLRYRESDLFNT